MKLNKLIVGLSVGVGIILILVMMITSWYNTAITLEENINTSQSNISKEEQRRVDLFNNLVDAIQSYNKFENKTLTTITQARSQANKGNIAQANLTIQAVVEAYPDLKSQDNYKQAMLEFSITENRIAGYREQFNNDVRSYNRLTRSFPASPFLSLVGYDKKDFTYLDYKVDNSQARNLFSNEKSN